MLLQILHTVFWKFLQFSKKNSLNILCAPRCLLTFSFLHSFWKPLVSSRFLLSSTMPTLGLMCLKGPRRLKQKCAVGRIWTHQGSEWCITFLLMSSSSGVMSHNFQKCTYLSAYLKSITVNKYLFILLLQDA